MRERSYYKQQTTFDKRAQAKPSDGKVVTDDPQLILDVLENVRKMDDRVRRWKLEDGIHWTLGFDAYVKDKTGTLKQKYKNEVIFKRGDIVLVDFFGHFGTELTYEHPAIVLADTFDGIIISPISSKCYKDGVDFHVSLDRKVPDLGDVPNNCGIKLEQSRFISKKRVLYKFKRVSNTEKLNEIDDVLMKIMTPISHASLKKHEQDLVNTTQQLVAATEKTDELLQDLVSQAAIISEKEDEILRLNRRIQLLEQGMIPGHSEDNVS